MKTLLRLTLIIGLAAAVVAGLVLAYREMRKERNSEATAETPVLAPSRAEKNAQGTTAVKLDAETAQRLGLRTALLGPGSAARGVTVYARVLEGGALAGQINEIRGTEAALEAAKLDLNRKQQLYNNGRNTTISAVETAEALVKQNQIAWEAARDRLVAAWGKDMVKQPDLFALARSLLDREAALVRIEIPAASPPLAAPERVRLTRPNREALATARVLGSARSVDSAMIGAAYLGLVTTNSAALVPGASLLADIETGDRIGGTLVPREALVRYKGEAWVYLETAPHTYERRRVTLDQPHPDGWLVPGEWKAPAVVSGAQSLLSEELKGGIQLRD
jgi:hypothetical protein